MDEIDRDAIMEALRKRGKRGSVPAIGNTRPEMSSSPIVAYAYWQGWIDAHCEQNAIGSDEVEALERMMQG